jgi:hypothetical protein
MRVGLPGTVDMAFAEHRTPIPLTAALLREGTNPLPGRLHGNDIEEGIPKAERHR